MDTAPDKISGPHDNYWQKCKDGKWWLFSAPGTKIAPATFYESHLLEALEDAHNELRGLIP